MKYSIVYFDSSQVSSTLGCYVQYVLDSEDDLSDVPVSRATAPSGEPFPRPGSIVTALDTKTVYMLSNARAWEVLFKFPEVEDDS